MDAAGLEWARFNKANIVERLEPGLLVPGSNPVISSGLAQNPT
jgi:hypothetical protein